MLDRRSFAKMSMAAFLGSARGESNPAIAKAMQAVKAAVPKAEADPERPVYHFRPPAQWNNDPNGPLFHRGWFHLFYQHNPYEARWGHMHWGHARSRDLVNWEHLPIALWPSLDKGEEHVFSGAAIRGPDGRPLLFYTSIGKRDPEQWLAAPLDDDLIRWEKHPGNPVLSLKNHRGLEVREWRDPFLFTDRGRTYMVCGGNLDPRGGFAAVQLYRAENAALTEWNHLGPVFRHPSKSAWNIECPNLFPLDGKWVLLISPHAPVEYFVGDLDLAKPLFTPSTCGVLDPGTTYASNICFDERGRCILWLWGRTETEPEKGWNSVMALPRVLTTGEDGHLRQNPAPEIEALRGREVSAAAAVLENRSEPLGRAFAGDVEIAAEFEAATAGAVGLRVAGSEIAFSPGSGWLSVNDRQKAFVGRTKRLTLRVFVDRRVTEIYVNGGAAAIFTLNAPLARNQPAEAFAEKGAARLLSARAWPIKPARFDMDLYV